jgi:RNA polymerase sigma factor (sigma-70 family)
METLEGPSDAELIARVRGGDLEAYGELFGRHHLAAERMARQLVPANDADDLASDAFAKVLDALRSGGGPDVSFRAYLLTTVRRVHVDRVRSGRKVQTTDDIASYERTPETFDDPTVTGFESGAAAKAFASLPERWQAVLWHTEVEGEKPAAIAPLLGLTANGVSALAYRAREGLRQAYLQQHLADVAGDRCRWTTERLGAYVRGGLTKRENRNVREHLDECAKCTAVYLELVEVNSSLPALLAPALLGAAGLGYLTAASGAKFGLTSFVVSGWKKATANGTRTAISAGAVVVVGLAAIVTAKALIGSDDPSAAISNPSSQQSNQRPGSSTTVPPGGRPTVEPTSTNPTTAPTTGPTTTGPTTAPTSGSTTVGPTNGSTTGPTTGPSQPVPTDGTTAIPGQTTQVPPGSTTPILDEGLLTISIPSGGARSIESAGASQGGYAAERFVLSIKTPAGNREPVVIGIKYGSGLSWPLSGNPTGWTCDQAAHRCTATNPTAPEPMSVTFDKPVGGSTADRTFTVSANTGRYYDDDAEQVGIAPPQLNENLLKITAGKPDLYFHHRVFTVAPGSDRTSVTLKITYGASLAWPIAANPAGWNCSARTQTCTADSPARPAPLYADFAVPKDGPTAARTYTVNVTAGPVYDKDSEPLAGLRQDPSLLTITAPGLLTDPNLLVYNRFLNISGEDRRPVRLDISWGANLQFLSWPRDHGWTCQQAGTRRAICTTPAYTSKFNSQWRALPGGSAADYQFTVHARAIGREDTDVGQIPRLLLLG